MVMTTRVARQATKESKWCAGREGAIIRDMKHLPIKEVAWALVFVVLLFSVYVGAYFALVDRIAQYDSVPTGSAEVVGEVTLPPPVFSVGRIVPQYRVGDEWARTVFGHIYEIDRIVRPDHWNDDDFIREHQIIGWASGSGLQGGVGDFRRRP